VMTLVGRSSWFVYTIDPAPHARAGRLTTTQERRLRARPKRQHHGGYAGSFTRALDAILPLGLVNK